jgi:hypothetical protein
VLESANICPGCQHHLRFNAATAAEPETAGFTAMKVQGSITQPAASPQSAGEQCEYCVVVSITNDRGEKIARNVVGVGALQPGERHHYSFSVEMMPARPKLVR